MKHWRLVHAHGDIGGLLVNVRNDTADLTVKPVLGTVITNVTDDFPGNLGNIHIAAGGNLTHDVNQTRGNRGLAGYASLGILRQNGVQHGIGDLIADLIGMAFGYGFRSKQKMSCHIYFSF